MVFERSVIEEGKIIGRQEVRETANFLGHNWTPSLLLDMNNALNHITSCSSGAKTIWERVYCTSLIQEGLLEAIALAMTAVGNTLQWLGWDLEPFL